MTKMELVDTYLEYRGLKRKKGDSLAPILPFLMMDCEYQLFCKTILPLEVSHLAKKLRNEWKECYTKGNREFFRAYKGEEIEQVTDLMDDFEEYIKIPLGNAKEDILKYCDFMNLEEREVITVCLLCNILSQAASHVWSHVYRTPRMKKEVNPWIEGVKRYSILFSNEWYRGGKGVNCNDSKEVEASVDALCESMINWLKV